MGTAVFCYGEPWLSRIWFVDWNRMMKKARFVQIVVIVLAGAALVLVLVFMLPTRSSRADAEGKTAAPVVATVTAKRAPVASTISVAGEFLPWEEVELRAKVSAYIQQIS